MDNIIKIEKTTSYVSRTINLLTPIILAFVIAMIPIIIKGENPLYVYSLLFTRTIFNARGITLVLHYMAPILLTALAIAISFKAGLFNMGIEGSLLSAGFTAAILGYELSFLPSYILIPLLLVVGIIVGMLVQIVPALLKAFYNVNEMVVTLLLNYAIIEVLKYLARGVFRDPASGYVSTRVIGANAMFVGLGRYSLTLFSFIAILVFILMYVIFKKTKLGYSVELLGKNPNFALATGFNLKRKIIVIMLISGALAGLAGCGWMLSEKYSYTESFSGNPGLGWDGMIISLLGSHSPIGILIGAIFYACLKIGGNEISFATNIPAEIIGIIQALIILFLSFKVFTSSNSALTLKLKHKITKLYQRGGKNGSSK